MEFVDWWVVRELQRRAEHGVFTGYQHEQLYIVHCTAETKTGARVIFTRDTGHHTSGWFKNPDYERCFHLSLSFWDPTTQEVGRRPTNPRSPEPGEAEAWVKAFYGPWTRYVWEESPKSELGISAGVHHYRVFCEPHWTPIIPRGEVYTTDFTEKGWKSWSEQQAEPLPKRLQKLADE